MIFIRYENWRSYLKYYPVTSIILLINLIMFLVLTFNGGSTDTNTLLRYGAIVNSGDERGEVWRYIAAIFLHNGFEHLLFNCFALLVFIPPLERLMGWWRYALLYVLGGVAGNLAAAGIWGDAMKEVTVSVGASGAIFAAYGAYLYIALFQRSLMDENSRKTLFSLLIIGVISSFITPNVSWEAHIGGLIAGFILYGLIIRLFSLRRSR
ncbi:rhomboid family intramembrane serine protease [Paenibacillus sp. HN-1]|uniref:rhomboid family intramembrane serine protease n=1 Tax=Paenibacillus TaxID=44249 RepID=UPI001CA931FF|nr:MULTISPECIES: rhomboid family intramembrane serine protease [Paenibacillus]MBY9082478.1 rhomboid family intramembrane serine protease [Paenibacillus sp. CGMCC 1.18879]MBY9084837.1 rhomboid family intramembrane serine protease [Paenibacillus sinensis]